jgi:peptidoglycan/xylan/chitin deacetylase (PgdA/CDA1 family)
MLLNIEIFSIIIVLLAILVAAAYLCFMLLPRWDAWLWKVRRKHSGKKICAITFDDGPDAPWTEDILSILARNSVKATFFVRGDKARASKDITARISKDGHDIGNHTESHKKIPFRSRQDYVTDIIRTSNAIAESTGALPKLFRAPHGFKTLGLLKSLRRLGLTLVPWTKGIWDTEGCGEGMLFARFCRKFENLEILLLHDGTDERVPSKDRLATVAVLPRIIEEYRRRGYEFRRISEL